MGRYIASIFRHISTCLDRIGKEDKTSIGRYLLSFSLWILYELVMWNDKIDNKEENYHGNAVEFLSKL